MQPPRQPALVATLPKWDTPKVMTLEECRRFYAEEIRFSGNIHSQELLEAFARVPREKFLGSGPWEIASPVLTAIAAGEVRVAYTRIEDPHQLYHDVLIVLDKDKQITNGQPSSLARWIEALQLRANDKVHHLGCGVGYYTAIIAEVIGPEGLVVGSEVDPLLVARAKQNLASYANVKVYAGDGAAYNPGPCDAMLVNAGVTHPLPLWLDRLNDGGRLVLPLTMAMNQRIGAGIMAKITRKADVFSVQVVSPVGIYSCTSARDQELEPVLKKAVGGGAIMGVQSVRRDSHQKTDSCIVHGAEVCLSSAAAA
jgi:protein-L-isoaspartate(D-aspartate) O-methyltransferase